MNSDYLQNLVRAMKTQYPGQMPGMPFMNPYGYVPGCDWPCGDSKEVKLIKELLEKVKGLEEQVKQLKDRLAGSAASNEGYRPYY